MRTIRRLGLLLAAAVCVSAFAAASASASGVACTSATDADPGTSAIECPTADLYGEDVLGAGNAPLDVTLAPNTDAVFHTSFPSADITCNESSGGGEITESGDNVATGPAGYLSTLDFTQNGSQNCPTTLPLSPTADTTALDNNGGSPGLWDVGGAWLSDNTSGSPNGTLTLGNVKVEIAIGSPYFVTCTYSAASVVGDLYNTGNGEQLVFSNETLTGGGGFPCPSSGDFTATYSLTAPSDLYIRSDDA